MAVVEVHQAIPIEEAGEVDGDEAEEEEVEAGEEEEAEAEETNQLLVIHQAKKKLVERMKEEEEENRATGVGEKTRMVEQGSIDGSSTGDENGQSDDQQNRGGVGSGFNFPKPEDDPPPLIDLDKASEAIYPCTYTDRIVMVLTTIQPITHQRLWCVLLLQPIIRSETTNTPS